MKFLRHILKRLRFMKSNRRKKTTWRLAEQLQHMFHGP